MNLQEKLEKARQNLSTQIESQEEIQVEELIDNVEYPEIIESLETEVEVISGSSAQGFHNVESTQDVIQLWQLMQDFEYIRETLRENQQNGRRVLRSIAQDIMDSEEGAKASLIMSFQELNRAIQDNISLYITTYKTISDTLKNIQQIQKNQGVDNTKTVSNFEAINTQDVLQRLREKKEN